jgi:hypothetical protein
LDCLTRIIEDAGHVILNYTTRIFEALEKHWHGDYTREASIVYSSLVLVTHGRCETILYLLVSVSFLLLKSKKNVERSATELSSIARFARAYLPTIIAGVTGILNSANAPVSQLSLALDSLEFIVRNCLYSDHVSAIRRCLIGVCSRPQIRWRDRANGLLLTECSGVPRSKSIEVMPRSRSNPLSVKLFEQ